MSSGIKESEPNSRSYVAELLGDRNYRSFWLAQVLVFGTNGTVRFLFVWLIVTLTDWSGAEGLVGIALGLPALILALPAGAWSDRVDRIRFTLVWIAASVIVSSVFATIIATDLATPRSAGIAAAVLGTTLVMMQPNLNAIVPLLVEPDRLMNAAALQNGGGQAASFLGLAVGGAAVALAGNAAGFALLAFALTVSFVLMRRVELPHTAKEAEVTTNESTSLRAEIGAGLRHGLGAEPRRSLLIAALILGTSFSVMQIALPRVVEQDFGRGSLAAGLLLGTFGIGMLASSVFVARRDDMRHGRNVALFIGIGLGLGQLLLSFAPTYGAAIVVMLAWGINAGLAIASHRTLLQRTTSPDMMGRVMGIMTLGFAGGLPFGALTQAVLAPALGPVMTMRWVGFVTILITAPLLFRRVIRTL